MLGDTEEICKEEEGQGRPLLNGILRKDLKIRSKMCGYKEEEIKDFIFFCGMNQLVSPPPT